MGKVVSTSLTIDELRQRLGEISARRQFLFARFQTVLRLLSETGQLRRLYLFGSFTTVKPAPGDLDCLAVMAAGFTTTNLTSPHLEVFQHDTCRLLYQTDVFWVTESVAQEQVDAMLDVFSRNREGASQPIIEVTL
jgi:uncharacterized protein DUF6932